ncbi:MAG: PTS transporter subunit IIC [Candidatus Izemoplasmataceae bacterium]
MAKENKVLNYFVKTLNGMAYGLFSTLIIGVIIRQIGIFSEIDAIFDLGLTLMGLMGVGIGLGVAWSLDLKGLSLIAGAMAGGIATSLVAPDPVVAYLTSIAAIEGLRFILRKKTPLDILLIPLVSAFIALVVVLLIGEPVRLTMALIGDFIQTATTLQPFLMGVIIAVVMGMALTAPISSAAIAISIQLSGIAGGAAVVGGAVQMIGFAVMSRKDNNIGTVISVGLGTSMLQFKNILKRPIIWLPTIIISGILGPLSTMVFKIETNFTGSGMGTSAFIGQFMTIEAMGNRGLVWLYIIVLHFALPIILVGVVDYFFRKKGLIKPGDLSLKTNE